MPLRTYGQAFLSRPAAHSQRLWALLVVVMMGLSVIFMWPLAQHPVANRAAFEPVWLVALTLSQGLTGLLLGLQASQLRHPTLALLAGAYSFLAVTAALQLLAYPGMISVTGWPEITTRVGPWMAVFGRLVFPLWVLLAAWQLDRAVPHWLLWLAWLAPTLLAPVAGFIIVHATGLPALINQTHYSDLLTHRLLPISIVIVGAVLAAVCYLTRLRTRLHLWLCVMLAGQFCSLLLTAIAGSQHTTGWYGSRTLMALSSVVLLAALLWDIHDIHRNLQRLNARLHDDAIHDGLTGLLHRNPFMELLKESLAPKRTGAAPEVALLLIDVDHFKAYNDAFGHLAGDACLTAVASALRAAAPARSAVARHGGEEFAVLLTGKAAENPAKTAEALRLAVWRQHLPHARQTGLMWVSISVGWGIARAGMATNDLLEGVDQALYRAKHDGRNRIVGMDEPVAVPENVAA